MRRLILFIVVYGAVLVIVQFLTRDLPAAASVWVVVCAILSVLALLAYLFRHKTVGGINPLALYLWLAVALGICVGIIRIPNNFRARSALVR